MEAKSDARITEKSVLKAVEHGAKSPTAVAKALGYKSGSSGVLKSILKVVPDLRERLQSLNDGQEISATAKSVNTITKDDADNDDKKDKGHKEIPVGHTAASAMPEDIVPYRPSSGYAQVWSILFAHRKDGITKKDLIAQYMKRSGKEARLAGYDVQVVCSPKEDGTCNRSASRAARHYWVERKGDLLKLHLVNARG